MKKHKSANKYNMETLNLNSFVKKKTKKNLTEYVGKHFQILFLCVAWIKCSDKEKHAV